MTRLSPYLTHGLLNLPQVAAHVHQRSRLQPQHKFVMELGWREYYATGYLHNHARMWLASGAWSATRNSSLNQTTPRLGMVRQKIRWDEMQ